LTAISGAMKNITITLRDEIADWLRVEAAKADLSMSAFVADVLEARMGRGKDQLAALEVFLGGAGFAGIAADLPKRDELYDRPTLRRHQHSDLRARSGRSFAETSIGGFAEADDQQPLINPEPAKSK
jgi:hypothetical protein